jgi:hypothetical protein
MPTIQEEMSKILNEWDNPEQPTEIQTMNTTSTKQLFGVTNNVTRVTFEHVKNHPGHTASEVAHALVKRGYKPASVTSLMAQMTRQGMMRKDGLKYYVAQDEYTPLKARSTRKSQAKKAVVGGIATLPKIKPEIRPEIQPLVIPTAQDIVDTLTLREARELYNELCKYFGDEK